MSIESQLREALAARADEVGGLGDASGDPYARVAGAIAVSRRRRRTAAIAGVAAIAALAVAIPSVGDLGRDTTTPAKHNQTILPGPTDPSWGTMGSWPTRGRLANDGELVAALGDRMAGHVVYVDDIGARRVAIAVDLAQRKVSVAEGPRGAQATEMGVTSNGPAEAAVQQGVLTLTVDESTLVVLTRPDVTTMEFSDGVQIGLDGRVNRTWEIAKLTDGMGQVAAGSPMLRVRVRGFAGPALFGVGHDPQLDQDNPSLCGDCVGTQFQSSNEAYTRWNVARLLSLPVEELRTTTVYAGEVDTQVAAAVASDGAFPAGTKTLLYVGNTTLPAGQVVRTATLFVHGTDGSGQVVGIEEATPLDARTATGRPFVLSGQGKSGDRTLVAVVGGGGTAQVRLSSDAPTLFPDTPKMPLQAGVATFILDETGMSEHRRVQTFDAAGSLIGTWPLDRPNRDPYDVQP